MSNLKKLGIKLTAITCLVFTTHSVSAIDLLPLQHIINNRIKSTLIGLAKVAKKFVMANDAQKPSGLTFISGLALAATGSYILLTTILPDLPKILGASAIIAAGATLVLFAQKRDP